MSASALICLAPGSEETEAVTTIDLLVRGGIKVTTASVASDGSLTIVCSRGVKLLADAPLVEVADGDFDILVLPGGIKGAEYFATARCWLKRYASFIFPGASLRRFAAAATVLVPHNLSHRQYDPILALKEDPRRAVAG
jgi:4-methyl-5(b-hydroxyethyl)-thiazole monophosphate biosynthesis